MDNFYSLLEKLDKNNIYFCFQLQPQPTGHKYYNLTFKDREGKNKYFSGTEFKVIEEGLKMHYGHLQNVPTLPIMPPLPLPLPR